MPKTKQQTVKRIPLLVAMVLIILGLVSISWYKNWQGKFEAPRQNSQPIEFTISKDKTLVALTGDLHYFEFIKDESSFEYALEHSKDNTSGNSNSLRIGITQLIVKPDIPFLKV